MSHSEDGFLAQAQLGADVQCCENNWRGAGDGDRSHPSAQCHLLALTAGASRPIYPMEIGAQYGAVGMSKPIHDGPGGDQSLSLCVSRCSDDKPRAPQCIANEPTHGEIFPVQSLRI